MGEEPLDQLFAALLGHGLFGGEMARADEGQLAYLLRAGQTWAQVGSGDPQRLLELSVFGHLNAVMDSCHLVSVPPGVSLARSQAGDPGASPQAGAASAVSASFRPTRSATMSMSVRCLTITDIVSLNVVASMSLAPSSSNARAQSIDSAIEGGFLRSSSLHHAHYLHQPVCDGVGEVGRVQLDDRQLVLQARVVEPQVKAPALERLSQLSASCWT